MEFKITRENFLEGLSKTQGVVEKKNTMPVLSNVLLQADKNGLKISATDLEVAITSQVPAQVATPGKITVHGRSLMDIVREMNQMEISVSVKENDRIHVSAGSSSFNIPGLSANEFPATPKVEAKSVEFPCEIFSNMIEKTSFSMSTNETRLNLAGILLEGNENGMLKMVATDGHRLSLVEKDVANKELGAVRVIIPRKGINELKKMVSKEGTFELGVGDKNLFARKGNETLYVRLIDGEFPDYRRVVPEKNDKFASIPKDKFVGALRRVSLLSDERSQGVVLAFSSGHLKVSVSNNDLGEAKEEFEIDYKGEKIDMGFNARYFLDVLGVVQGEQIILAIQNDLAPCLIKSEADSGFLSVIMPMRI